MTDVGFLTTVPLFRGLSEGVLRELASRLRERRYRAGEAVFHQDDPGGQLYLISAGQVRITMTSADGRERDVALLNAGDYFGEMSVLDDSPRSATARVTAEVHAFVLDRAGFHAFLIANPEVAFHLAISLAKRLRHADEMLADATFLDVPRRVAKSIAHLARTVGRPLGAQIQGPVDQDGLARLVGATRET
ncbi:MAG: Crp/Fnr family transcriptional regulator, partial [Chloroflexi bacterium]|nr:Crp/Fnr family transcriptional regulator [Chloroflexota bacterium]